MNVFIPSAESLERLERRAYADRAARPTDPPPAVVTSRPRGTGLRTVPARIPGTALRLARPDAVDTARAIASPDIYDLLVRRAGYSLDRFEEWIAVTLRAAHLVEEQAMIPWTVW